jgi:DNA-binding MarR family transcriptional regulator
MIVTVSWMIMPNVKVNVSGTLAKAMSTATTRGRGSMVLVTRLAREIYRASSEDVLGMRLKQSMLLGELRDSDGEMPQQTLCGAMHLDPNNLVLMLNELEDAGYIERKRDPEDRRRHIVELTSAGKRALERAEKGMESVEVQVLAALNKGQRAELRKLLAIALSDGEDQATSAADSERQAAAASVAD